MSPRPRPTFAKRQKELARQEKQRAKAERRRQRTTQERPDGEPSYEVGTNPTFPDPPDDETSAGSSSPERTYEHQ